mmetsp:Transcript_28073/g.80952  ORF Transcript_28073/g.80952 Transcript_28073/m.80952 type:complete len:251 (-) Transcript_28073:225-977(-)
MAVLPECLEHERDQEHPCAAHSACAVHEDVLVLILSLQHALSELQEQFLVRRGEVLDHEAVARVPDALLLRSLLDEIEVLAVEAVEHVLPQREVQLLSERYGRLLHSLHDLSNGQRLLGVVFGTLLLALRVRSRRGPGHAADHAAAQLKTPEILGRLVLGARFDTVRVDPLVDGRRLGLFFLGHLLPHRVHDRVALLEGIRDTQRLAHTLDVLLAVGLRPHLPWRQHERLGPLEGAHRLRVHVLDLLQSG